MKVMTICTVAFGLTGLALAGCGGGGGSSSPAPVSPIIGTFKETSITGNNQSVTCPGTVTLADGTTDTCGASDTFQFKPDGTFVATSQGVSFSGTYTYVNGTLNLKVTAPSVVAGQTISGPVSFGPNNATLIFPPTSAADTTDTYTRQ